MSKVLGMLNKGVIALGQGCLVVSIVLLLFIMSIGALDSLTTAFLSKPIPATTELTEEALAATVFLAMAYAQQMQQNVAVDLFVRRLTGTRRRVLLFFATFAGGVFFCAMAWRAVAAAVEAVTLGQYAPGAVPVPVYPFKVAVAVALVVATLEYVRQSVWLLLSPVGEKRTQVEDRPRDIPA